MRYLLWHLKFLTPWSRSFFLRNKELPSVPPRAFSHPKNDLANVLDVGFLFRLVCAIPTRHNFSIHRLLDYGVVVCESVLIIFCLAFKLILQRFKDIRDHAPQCPNGFFVFSLALRLFTFHELLAFARLISHIINEHFPCVSYSIFNLLLELIALWVILGNVFHFPIALFLALVPQRLIDEGVGATNLPCRFHSILEELDFVRFKVRQLDELIFVCRSLLLLRFHHLFLPLLSFPFQHRPHHQWEPMYIAYP